MSFLQYGKERLHEELWIYFSRYTYMRMSFLYSWFCSHVAGKSVLFLNYNSQRLTTLLMELCACVCVSVIVHVLNDSSIRQETL